MLGTPVTVDEYLGAHYDRPSDRRLRDLIASDRAARAEQVREWQRVAEEATRQADALRQTLRDEFAKAALAGFLAEFTGAECSSPSPSVAATYAYDCADAMLAERERRK